MSGSLAQSGRYAIVWVKQVHPALVCGRAYNVAIGLFELFELSCMIEPFDICFIVASGKGNTGVVSS